MIKLCECGCGQPTKIITKIDNKLRRIKGEYSRFINGHQNKGKNNPNYGIASEKHPNWRGGKIKRNCEYCDKKFFVKPSAIKRGGKFCSVNCSLKFRIGKNNFNWKNGITPLYNQIRNCFEYRQWRSDVFTRDKFTCQKCGDAIGGNLIAHHIVAFADILKRHKIITFEEAIKCEELWNINNGITYCKDCHIEIHGKVK